MNITFPETNMVLETTSYGYKSVNCSADTPVRIYKLGNMENRTYMPEVIGFPVLDEFEELEEAVKFAETRATILVKF